MPDQPKTDWQIDRFLPFGSLCVLFGLPSAGKTALLCGIASTIASGQAWYTNAVLRPGPVVWLVGEGAGGIKRRIRAWCSHHGIDIIDVERRLYILEGCPRLDIEAEEIIAAFDERSLHSAALIIVDTLARHMGGDRDKASDITKVISGCDRLQKSLGGPTIILVHHTNWSAREDVSASREAGSINLRAGVDMSMGLVRDSRKDGPLNSGERVTLSLAKPPRDGEPWCPMRFEARTGILLPDDPPDASPGFALALVSGEQTGFPYLGGVARTRGRTVKPATENAKAAMLDLLANKPASQQELISVSGIPRASAQRVLNSLIAEGHVSHSTRGAYKLTTDSEPAGDECP
ncbi:AAA family ATPase [Azospirillum argentinense]|uniref:AAA family ATPase n=1 Tax=Azospirillum argentinense TaxID=2970906 RepID=A0ABW8VD27_9PROT